jgi:hypothetical protein
MASTIMRSPTGDARDTGRRVILPVMRGVTHICFPRTTEAHAVYNWKDGGSACTISGTVTYGAGFFVSSAAANRLNTELTDSNELTYYVVARSGAAFSSTSTRPLLVGTFQSQSGGIAGAAIYVTGTPGAAPAATMSMTAASDVAGVPTQAQALITVTNFSNWTLLAGACDNNLNTNSRRIYDKTNGVSAAASSAPSGARLLATSTFIRLGNCTSLSQGTCDVAAVVLANVAHTAAEIESNAIAIRRRLLAFHSIVV